ncbi:MAG TPA: protein kinase [Candidatus Angelobacter sp.]|nr:protein kinase [Candidatus Angelobacter sp.]
MASELSDSAHGRVQQEESPAEQQSLGGGITLYLRLWSYGGAAQPLTGLGLDQDPEVAELIRQIIREGKGSVAEQHPELLAARFDYPIHALSSAKELQQRFLTYHRKSEPQQVVPSILIAGTVKNSVSGANAAPPEVAPAEILANGTSAQILVSEAVYEVVKTAPGYKFNSKPVRESGGTGGPEAIYELLWTDKSTYGHLRDSGSTTGFKKVGRYEIQEELGRGAMGVVYKAYDQLIGRTVALKTISIHRNTPDRDDLIERLKQEAKAAGGLDHPNIITIYDVGQEDDLIYLSMQFIEGKTLLTVMAENPLPPLPTVISYADQILSGVGFAHARGVIHRDLKPANLMLTTQGIVKVLDFGIAKVENASLTQTGLVVGTPSHMAPEQVSGKKVDHRADIFALGSVFYELVTREKPFRGDVTTILYKIMHEDPVAPSLINPSLPGGIDAIIRRALAKDPNDRFQSCEEMRQAFLEQATQLDVKPASVVPIPVPVAASKPATRSPGTTHHKIPVETQRKKPARSWIAVSAAVLLLIIGVVDWSFITKGRTGSFPPVVVKIVGIFNHKVPPAASGKPDQAAGESDPNAVTGDTASGTAQPATSKPASSDASTAAPVQTSADGSVPPAASAQPANAGATGSNLPSMDKSQPPADSSHASPVTLPVPAANGTTQAGGGGTTNTAQPSAATTAGTADKVQPPGTSNPAPNSAAGKNPSSSNTTDGAVVQTSTQPVKKTAPAPANVDGFTRRDVPELLRQADTAAGRGDYRLARYEYGLILRLDPSNSAARAAMRRLPPQ